MGMQCAVCGKKPVVGNQKTYRGNYVPPRVG